MAIRLVVRLLHQMDGSGRFYRIDDGRRLRLLSLQSGLCYLPSHGESLVAVLPSLGRGRVSFLYYKFGKSNTKGNNLILEQIHGGTESIPLRMAPLVLIGTLITHLFGDLQDVRALPFRWEEVYRSGSVSLSALRRRIENTANLRN